MNLKNFVGNVTKAKIETERVMRKSLDQRILNIKVDKLASLVSNGFAAKLKTYVKMYADYGE